MLVLSVERPDLGIAPISAVLLGVTAAIILLSSLIDWYVILPRISGLLGIRPCREPDTDFPRRPQTWREVTRWWYIHRIIAALALRSASRLRSPSPFRSTRPFPTARALAASLG